MKLWLQQHVASFKATVRRLVRTPVATLLSALAIGASLALPLGAYVLLENLQRVAAHFDGNPQLTIYMAPDASKEQAEQVAAHLKTSEIVREFRWVPREAALAQMKSSEVGELLNLLDSNPLPDAYVVDLRTDALSRTSGLAQTLQQQAGVAEVQWDTLWVQRLEALLRVGAVVVTLLATILAFGLAAVTFNTVRMQILQHRDEYEVAKLVGATDAWVRRPFYYQGALLGLLGAGVALGLLALSSIWLNRELAVLGATYALDLRLSLPPAADLLGVGLFATLLGWVGAHLSVSRHLLQR